MYENPTEPNYGVYDHWGIPTNGTLPPLQPLHNHLHHPSRFCERIVSGGQTGVDRGALNFAIEHGYSHGGWVPRGRRAEDGIIPLNYQLTEMTEGGYRQRTRRNIQDSDGTLIVNLGPLDGGTLATQTFAAQIGKTTLVAQLDIEATADAVTNALAWLRHHSIKTLNIAGPRESKRPGIHNLTVEFLRTVDHAIRS
ncbi:putative molybdenum carrier protein [Ottowia thiooxydans]|uniref:putative molybdenum carrier protein n=1 Tax=Ottowia thiooxydans TaxID=219182 RepID=UPI00040136E0|nr:putative molybdenum carrier protein [Ottowia thiooxydans]